MAYFYAAPKPGPSPWTLTLTQLTQLPCHQGLEPLRYQWYKDGGPGGGDRKVAIATSDTPNLIIAEVALTDQGQYYCQVGGGTHAAASERLSCGIVPESVCDIDIV